MLSVCEHVHGSPLLSLLMHPQRSEASSPQTSCFRSNRNATTCSFQESGNSLSCQREEGGWGGWCVGGLWPCEGPCPVKVQHLGQHQWDQPGSSSSRIPMSFRPLLSWGSCGVTLKRISKVWFERRRPVSVFLLWNADSLPGLSREAALPNRFKVGSDEAARAPDGLAGRGENGRT